MKRFFLFIFLLGLAAVSTAQITVTNGGYATQSGPAYPATPISPPILYPPIVHLGEGQTQPIQATAQTNGVMPATEMQQQQQNTNSAQNQQQPFNFGAAQFGEPGTEIGLDSDGKSLGEIAREMKQKPNGTNARVYTNEDLQSLPAGSVGGAAANVNPNADNWSPNNGIINPEGQPQNSVAAPTQNESTTGTQQGPRSPFAPPSNGPNNLPANNTGIVQDNSPQSQVREPEIRPFAQRLGTTEMAQNNPPANPASQNAAQSNSNENQAGNNGANAQTLPKTASRLPLLGVLGLFTVTMGIFVRYQRAKAK